MSGAKKQDSILKLGLVLFVITFVVALALGFVNNITKDKIEEQAKLETTNAIQKIYAQASDVQKLDLPDGVDKRVTEIYSAKGADGTILGYALKVLPNGFGGAIDIMVGVLPDNSIKSIQILATNSETPGLGTKITEDKFRTQYDGKVAPIEVIKNGTPKHNQIVAISGATISSRGVTDGVDLAAETVSQYFGDKGGA